MRKSWQKYLVFRSSRSIALRDAAIYRHFESKLQFDSTLRGLLCGLRGVHSKRKV